jgi:hypothetical protein
MSPSTLRSCLVGIAVFFTTLAVHAAEPVTFRSAKPIWPKGRETEMNLLGGFRAVIDAPTNAKRVVLRVTAAYLYRAWLNGEFVGYGPARGPRGFFRVDEWDITKKLAPGKNLVAIEAVGYNCFSYYLLSQFFVDNAIRRNGKLERTRNRTEACQHFAFFFKVADHRKDAELWRKLRDEFGPCRDARKTHPDVPKLGGFISGPMRLDLLSEADCGPQIFKDVLNPKIFEQLVGGEPQSNSLDYSTWAGFTSVLVHVLYRDILGLRRVDTVNRRIEIRFQDIPLENCEGRVPTPGGPIALRWTRHPDRLEYTLRHPDGYQVTIQNLSTRTLVRR